MMTELIEILREDHRNIETLLLVLERELNIFDRAEQPHYEVAQAIIDYFRDYPDRCHHPKEDAVFAKLKTCDPAAAASVGDLEAEHLKGAKRLRLVARAVESVLSEQEVLRQTVDDIVRDFIEKERRHMEMELFPTAAKALLSEDWAEIDARLTKRFVARQSERREVQLAAAAHTAMGAGKRVRQADPLRLSAPQPAKRPDSVQVRGDDDTEVVPKKMNRLISGACNPLRP
jgi:hemerythrin-like domain-containing protein